MQALGSTGGTPVLPCIPERSLSLNIIAANTESNFVIACPE